MGTFPLILIKLAFASKFQKPEAGIFNIHEKQSMTEMLSHFQGKTVALWQLYQLPPSGIYSVSRPHLVWWFSKLLTCALLQETCLEEQRCQLQPSRFSSGNTPFSLASFFFSLKSFLDLRSQRPWALCLPHMRSLPSAVANKRSFDSTIPSKSGFWPWRYLLTEVIQTRISKGCSIQWFLWVWRPCCCLYL